MMATTTRAIDNVQHCTTMDDVRRHIDALDDVLVPLLVQRGGYMTQAARIKKDATQVRDEDRIEAIVARVRARTATEMPASAGEQGPGEITRRSSCPALSRASISATVISSLRNTSTCAPSSPKYWTML